MFFGLITGQIWVDFKGTVFLPSNRGISPRLELRLTGAAVHGTGGRCPSPSVNSTWAMCDPPSFLMSWRTSKVNWSGTIPWVRHHWHHWMAGWEILGVVFSERGSASWKVNRLVDVLSKFSPGREIKNRQMAHLQKFTLISWFLMLTFTGFFWGTPFYILLYCWFFPLTPPFYFGDSIASHVWGLEGNGWMITQNNSI